MDTGSPRIARNADFPITDTVTYVGEFCSMTENLYWWIVSLFHLVNFTAISTFIRTSGLHTFFEIENEYNIWDCPTIPDSLSPIDIA
jgi:hypothetical protein